MPKKDILIIENLASFEKIINKDDRPYDINMMCMPGTLEDKHKDVDPEKGIQALRRQFNLIYLLLGGVHDVHLGADYRWLQSNDLVIVPENMLYASSDVRNCTGYCIHFKTEFVQPLINGPITEQFPYLNSEAEHIINITDDESKLIQQSFKEIISEYERFSSEKDYLLRNYIYILLLRIREIYRPHLKQIKESTNRAAKLANRFKHLVEKNFIEKHEVQQYAEILHITSKYLTDVVKETFGKTPRDLINDMLLLEAKVQLGSTDKTVTEIALDLNFTDQSHFNHFIKQRTGYSPLEFREKWSSNLVEAKWLTSSSSY
ncbi:MAG: AraC family transcriptional regulator [Ignavibacteria bacterium RBG_16_35_7]|nr:MAG: AraC family transcriptional regulator [Ignavibacteria bacterium RBG_16_35_7]